jgi:hypothetical protein
MHSGVLIGEGSVWFKVLISTECFRYFALMEGSQ